MTSKETLKSRRVLLVDDDQSIRHSLSYYFRNKVGSFMALETAEEALGHLQDQVYDVVICDYRLPGMNGLGFFQQLNRRLPGALKILITAFGSLDVAMEAIKMGVHDFIMKPFQAATVEKSITGLIAKQKKESAGILVDGGKLREAEGQRLEQLEFLLGRISHQINNTLQGLWGNAEMGFLEVEEDNLLKARFNNILNGLKQVFILNKQLTCISKTFNTEPKIFDLNTVIVKCIHKYHDLIKIYGINVERHFDIKVIVKCDSKYLTDILDNILLNAIQGLHDNNQEHKVLEIYITHIGRNAQVIIIDNGIGMETEVVEKVFQKGFTTKERGNGMGLYIVNRLAQEIGATINLKSEKGKGTVVAITLPQYCRED